MSEYSTPNFVAPDSTSLYTLMPAYMHKEGPRFQHECGQHLWRAVSITTVRSWCKNLRNLSSKMVALIRTVKESSICFYRFSIPMTRSLALSVVAKGLKLIVSWSSTAWKLLMLASCRWIQSATLTRFPSLTRLMESLCMLMQRWLASFSTLPSTPCLSSAAPWSVLHMY